MKTIVISGSYSNIGKTLLAEEILHSFKDWSAIKVTLKRKTRCPRKISNGCGVCKEIKNDFSIITDKKVIDQPNTDTARLKKAGAKKVTWLKATLNGLKPGLEKTLESLGDSEGVVIEGTSVLRHINPDLTIYLRGKNLHVRASAKEAEKKADIIINVDK